MDPVTLALMGGAAGAQFLGGMGASKAANNNLAFQMLQADKQDRFSKAGETDAFGNETHYDEGLNRWISSLSPTQQRIAKAGEHEQLLSLMLDAPRNRAMREGAYNRAGSANDAADAELAKLRYGGPKSEGAITDELTSLLARSRTGSSNGTTAPQNLRQRGKVAVVKSGNPVGSNGGVDDIAKILLEARQGGMAEKSQRDQNFNATTGGRLGTFSQVAQGGGGVPINTNNMAGGQREQQARMAQARAQALSAISGEVGGAYNGVGKASHEMGEGMAKAFASFKPTTARRSPIGTGSTEAYYGGSPSSNPLLNPGTYGNIAGSPYNANADYDPYDTYG